MGANPPLQQQASHRAPHSISHAAQKRSTPDNITITQQLQDINQIHIRNHPHDPQHHRHRHRHQLNAEMQHSPVLHIHVCALRYEELNRRRMTSTSCPMNESASIPAATSVTSRPSLNNPHITTPLSPHPPHPNTAASTHHKSIMPVTLMLSIRILILIIIACMHSSSHPSCAFTSAPFDTRYSTVDKCPPRDAS